MSLQTQIWRTKDADLFRDLESYRRAIADNHFPEMREEWQKTVDQIEHEIEQRNLLAAVVTGWSPQPNMEVPF